MKKFKIKNRVCKALSLAAVSYAAMHFVPLEALADDPFENLIEKGQTGMKFVVTKFTVLVGSIYLFSVIWGVKAGTKQWHDVVKVLIAIVALSSVIGIAEFLVGSSLDG
jgi:hypothetical protein